MRSFEHHGIRFAYHDDGEGAPFVFQHGLGGDGSQPAALYRSAGRLITLECRGHGATEPLGPEDALGFATFAHDLDVLLDRLGLEQIVLGGVSMGAGVALQLAAARPERVRAIVLVRPAWHRRGPSPNLACFPRIAALLREHGPEAGKRVFAGGAEHAAVSARSPAAAASLLGQFDRPRAAARAAVLERLPADQLPDGAWGRLPMPALVVATRDDPVHPLTVAASLRATLPDARLRLVASKDAGEEHHRREVAAAIEDFLTPLGWIGAEQAVAP